MRAILALALVLLSLSACDTLAPEPPPETSPPRHVEPVPHLG